MCVVLTELKFEIATKSILTYKQCVFDNNNNNCYSLFYGKKYEINKLNKEVYIGHGIYRDYNYIKTTTGYYSYKYNNSYSSANALFVIPKGSKYVLGHDNVISEELDTYVSNQIIYVGRNNLINRWKTKIKIWMNIL